mmetsp:Transcript_65588/g.106315  ORF Transcript_65588/g.106315 Transcript_65588/m.106315 type:complete len:100 (-) Transcript_65588:78-377(-)
MSHMRMIQVTPVNVSIFSRVTCHMMILAWDMSHSHVCSDPPTCVKCLIRIPRLVHTCAMPHPPVCHNTLAYLPLPTFFLSFSPALSFFLTHYFILGAVK